MGNLLSNLLAMSIAGSVVVGLMLLLRPVTTKIFPAKWQYGIGKIAIAFFLIPVSLFAGKLPWVQPVMESYSAEPSIIRKALPSNGFVDTMDTLTEKHLSVELMEVVLLIWLAGAMVFAAWHFYCYRRFTKQLRVDSFPVSDDTAAAALLSSCKTALGIYREVKLMQNHKITSPMLVGLRRPVILLPASSMSGIDLKLVLTHELMHLKQKDLWVKMLALTAGTLHWFNPLAHVLRKDVSIWGEMSCDEALASEMSHEERKLYGEAILNTLDIHSSIKTAFCSSLCESKKQIERRLTMLLNVKKTKKHIVLLAVAAMLVIGAAGTAIATYAAENTPKVESALVGSMDSSKDEKEDTKEYYTLDEFKQWIKDARLEAANMVKSGILTQEQADEKLTYYDGVIADIEKNGGMTFPLSEGVKVFFTTDELVFGLPDKFADTINDGLSSVLSIHKGPN